MHRVFKAVIKVFIHSLVNVSAYTNIELKTTSITFWQIKNNVRKITDVYKDTSNMITTNRVTWVSSTAFDVMTYYVLLELVLISSTYFFFENEKNNCARFRQCNSTNKVFLKNKF